MTAIHTELSDCYCRECILRKDIEALKKGNTRMESQIKDMLAMIEQIKQSRKSNDTE